MKLSSKTITAIKMFIDLGQHYEEGYISLVDIAKRKDLSKKFLEQIVPMYKNAGLIIGTRGNQGGYRLAKEAQNISLKEIVYLSENNLLKDDINYAPIANVLEDIDSLLNNYLESVSLAKLIEAEQDSYTYNYCI